MDSHNDKTSNWLLPEVNWTSRHALPYGWEVGIDKNETPYYINHLTYSTTRDDPREDEDLFLVQRSVKLMRDPILGFGFVAGSEKPVIVRSVTEDGPCDGKLFAGDEILKINDEDVKMLHRDYIIGKVRSCKEFIYLTVAQPSMDKDKTSGRKSSLLSVSKKLKLKNNPSRVRFTEEVEENSWKMGKSEPSLLYLPSVLKVYLENHQTKSFKYDRKTTVRDVLSILQQKLGIKCMEHFSLLVQDMNSPSKSNMSFLQEQECLQKISARPHSHQWKCLFRVSFVPKDAFDLLRTDPMAFDYLYTQCCNDVVEGRFGSELKYETAIRLAALQIQEHVLSSKQTAKVSIKLVEKESGLERFLPESVLQGVKRKDVRRTINHYIKLNHNLTAPGQKHLTAMQAKLHYMKIVSELRTYGGRFFNATLISEDLKRSDVTFLVGPKNGISHVINVKNNVVSLLADFDHVTSLNIYPTEDNQKRVKLNIEEMKSVQLVMQEDEAKDFACLIDGYYKLFVNKEKSLLSSAENKQLSKEQDAPVFFGKHKVQSAEWSYPADLVSQLILRNHDMYSDNEEVKAPKFRKTQEREHTADFTMGPPQYQDDTSFLNSCMQMSLSGKEAGDGASTTDSHVEEIPITSINDITDNSNGTETTTKSTFTSPLPEIDYPGTTFSSLTLVGITTSLIPLPRRRCRMFFQRKGLSCLATSIQVMNLAAGRKPQTMMMRRTRK
ncbi:FERM and PDZ domain-containing protein 4-like isoform X2 [Ptychodera flava]|uniref:FERM and PDZ domain-containing protein 4-like isoform X2 n=1 Tax=Ptychodera flava TaxID=63121 RepID=UPI00396A8E04